jgi:hypothetical protein
LIEISNYHTTDKQLCRKREKQGSHPMNDQQESGPSMLSLLVQNEDNNIFARQTREYLKSEMAVFLAIHPKIQGKNNPR